MASLAAYPGMMRRDRERLGLSIGQAAYRLGVKPQEYRLLEAGEGIIPTYDVWRAMCELFGWPQAFVGGR